MGGKRIPKASRKLNAAKEVCIRKLHDGWAIDLPDWTINGNYHLHVKQRKWEELVALKECVEEMEGTEGQ